LVVPPVWFFSSGGDRSIAEKTIAKMEERGSFFQTAAPQNKFALELLL